MVHVLMRPRQLSLMGRGNVCNIYRLRFRAVWPLAKTVIWITDRSA